MPAGTYSEDEFESITSPRRNSTGSKGGTSPVSSTSTVTRRGLAPKLAPRPSTINKPKPKPGAPAFSGAKTTKSVSASSAVKGFSSSASAHQTHPKPTARRTSSVFQKPSPAPAGMARRKSKDETLLEAAMAVHSATSRRRVSVNSLPDFISHPSDLQQQQGNNSAAPNSPSNTPLIKIDSNFVAFQSPKSSQSKSPVTDRSGSSGGERLPTTPTRNSPTKGEGINIMNSSSATFSQPQQLQKSPTVKQAVRRMSAAGLIPAPGHDTPDGSGGSTHGAKSTQPPETEFDRSPEARSSPWQRDVARFNLDIKEVDEKFPHDYNDDGMMMNSNTVNEQQTNNAEQALFSFEEQMRHTPEYRVAWDLELWKAVQKKKVEKEVREFKKRLQDEARGSLLLQEKEIKKEMDKSMKELSARQKKIEEEDVRQEKRRVRLVDAEKELDRRMQGLSDQRRRVEEEADTRAKRLKAEYTHREEIANSKLHQSEEALKRLDERLQVSQKEYMRLWEDFSAFKTRQLTERSEAPETAAMERMRQQHHFEMIQLNERLEREHRISINGVIERLETSHQEVTKLSRMLTAQKERLRQLEQSNVQLSSQLGAQSASAHQQEQSYQRQLEAAQSSNASGARGGLLSDLTMAVRNMANTQSTTGLGGKGVHITNNHITGSLEGHGSQKHHSESTIPHCSNTTTLLHSQINLWTTERQRLLEMSGGAYTPKSEVIMALDRRIHQAKAQL